MSRPFPTAHPLQWTLVTMGLVVALLVGLAVGVAARLAFPDESHVGGVYMSALLGVVGAVLAWLFGVALDLHRHGEGTGLAGLTLGATLVLVIHRVVARASGP